MLYQVHSTGGPRFQNGHTKGAGGGAWFIIELSSDSPEPLGPRISILIILCL